MGQASAKLTLNLTTFTPVTLGVESEARILKWNISSMPITITYNTDQPSGPWRSSFEIKQGNDTLVGSLFMNNTDKTKNTTTFTLNGTTVKYYTGSIGITDYSIPGLSTNMGGVGLPNNPSLVNEGSSYSKDTKFNASYSYSNGTRDSNVMTYWIDIGYRYNSDGTRTYGPKFPAYYCPYYSTTDKTIGSYSKVVSSKLSGYTPWNWNVAPTFDASGIMKYVCDFSKASLVPIISSMYYRESTIGPADPGYGYQASTCTMMNSPLYPPFVAEPITGAPVTSNITPNPLY